MFPRVATRSPYRLARAVSFGTLLVLSAAIPLAGCGSSTSAKATAPASTLTAQDVSNATGTIHLAGWQFYQDDKAQQTGGVKAKWTYLATDSDDLTDARSNQFELLDSDGPNMSALNAIGTLAPIDTSLLSNYPDINSSLRNEPVWQNEHGQVVAVPFGVAPTFTAWNSSEVPEPKTVYDLLKPVYAKSIGLFDSPETISGFARYLGVTRTTMMTHAQLKVTMAYLERLRPNIKTFFQIGEDAQLFARHEIKVSLSSFGTGLGKIVESNPAIKFNFTGQTTYIDAWSLLRNANNARALKWLNATISVSGQRAIIEASGGYPVNPGALRYLKTLKDPVSQALSRMTLDEILKAAPASEGFAPTSKGKDIVTLDEATRAWDEYKSKF